MPLSRLVPRAFLSPTLSVLSGPTPNCLLLIVTKKKSDNKSSEMKGRGEEENRGQKITEHIPVSFPDFSMRARTIRRPARVGPTPSRPAYRRTLQKEATGKKKEWEGEESRNNFKMINDVPVGRSCPLPPPPPAPSRVLSPPALVQCYSVLPCPVLPSSTCCYTPSIEMNRNKENEKK